MEILSHLLRPWQYLADQEPSTNYRSNHFFGSTLYIFYPLFFLQTQNFRANALEAAWTTSSISNFRVVLLFTSNSRWVETENTSHPHGDFTHLEARCHSHFFYTPRLNLRNGEKLHKKNWLKVNNDTHHSYTAVTSWKNKIQILRFNPKGPRLRAKLSILLDLGVRKFHGD